MRPTSLDSTFGSLGLRCSMPSVAGTRSPPRNSCDDSDCSERRSKLARHRSVPPLTEGPRIDHPASPLIQVPVLATVLTPTVIDVVPLTGGAIGNIISGTLIPHPPRPTGPGFHPDLRG